MSTADTVVSHDGKPPETIRAADITLFGRQILFPGQCWVISSSAAHFLWRCSTSDQYLYINGCKYLPISYWTAILSLLDVADGVEEPFLLKIVFLSKFSIFKRPKPPDLCCQTFNGIIKFPLFKHTLRCVPKDDTYEDTFLYLRCQTPTWRRSTAEAPSRLQRCRSRSILPRSYGCNVNGGGDHLKCRVYQHSRKLQAWLLWAPGKC